jgi:hypothetical protein
MRLAPPKNNGSLILIKLSSSPNSEPNLRRGKQFFLVLYSTLLHLPPSDSTVAVDAGIEPTTVSNFGIGMAVTVPSGTLTTLLDLTYCMHNFDSKMYQLREIIRRGQKTTGLGFQKR